MKLLNYFLILTLSFLIYNCDSTDPKPPDTKPPGYQEDIPWPSLADSPWPLFGADPQNTKRSKGINPINGNLDWYADSFAVGSGVSFNSSSEIIFISGSQNGIVCLNQEGIQQWLFKFKDPTGSYPSTPAIGINDNIFVSGGDSVIYAISKNGELLWKSKNVFNDTYSISIGKNGNIFVQDGFNDIYCIDGNNGNIIWHKAYNYIRTGEASFFAFSPDGKTIYFEGYGKSLLAISAITGELIFDLDIGIALSSPSIDSDGNVYFLVLKNSLCSLVKYDNTGALIWEYKTSEEFGEGISIDKNGNIIFGYNKVYSISYKGNLNWQYDLGQRTLAFSPTTDKDSNINLFCSNNKYLQLDNLGNILFELDLLNQPRLGGWISYTGNNCLFYTSDGYILNKIK